MTCTRFRCALLVTLSLGFLLPAEGQVRDWHQIVIPPLPAFQPQQPHRVELSNGMVIFLQEDHELPLIRGTARIRGGSRDEPAAKAGLTSIYGEVWRTGGTKTRTGDELDDYLEARAARVETGDGIDSATISWDCLKGNFDEVFRVFVELLQEPEFRDDKIALAKNQLNTSISRRNDEPTGIAAREAQKLGYGADSPYARQPEYATVAAVTREDLVNWHHAYVHPNSIILGVVGDFDSKAMEDKLRTTFESWPRGAAPTPLQLSFNGPKAGVYFIQKDGVNQSNIRMVKLGTRRDNPDYYAITAFNEIFGGSFSSRLVEDVRTKKGLAYAVGGGIGTAFDHPGLFQISMGTKSGTTAAALLALDEEIDGLKTRPPTDEELKKAKDSILNSFVFEFDSKGKVLQARMNYEFYGYPANFLERYRAGIEKVTLEDVQRVAQKYVHKDQLAVLVVGKAADFDKPLSTFGPVANIDITIPPPPGEAKAATSTNSEGKELIAKVIQGLGGEARLKSVKSLREKSTLLAKTPQGDMSMEIEELAAFPDRLWEKMITPMGEMVMVVSPAVAFMKSPQGSQDLPGAQKEAGLQELKRHPVFVAQHADDPKFIFAAGGVEKIGEIEAQILDVNADGVQARWYVDPQTGHVLRTSAQSTGIRGELSLQVIDYSEWKDVDGLKMPFKRKITEGGSEAGSLDIKEVQINPTIDPTLFEKPAEKAPEKSGGTSPG